MNFLKSTRTHILVLLVGWLADQLSKLWAVGRLAHPDGTPTGEAIPVIGQWLRFRLAYNEGAAFSSRPQDLLPFLHPTVFYGLISVVAVVGLVYFYRTLPKVDWPGRLGTLMILSGAMGNLADRLRIHKVVDFIDSDFPDFIMHRWPTFNIADSLVLIGVGMVIVGPKLFKIPRPPEDKNAGKRSKKDSGNVDVKGS